MSAENPPPQPAVSSDMSDHVADARDRARRVLGGEAYVGNVDDWRRALVSANDAIVLVWLTWVALDGFGQPSFTGAMLVVVAVAFALLLGISTGRATGAQIQYYAAEFERERHEIRDDFEHECDEVRVLYAAKGFREPLLGQIVDTLSADDDRLLKVMMEEELGLSMHHMEHPLVVGSWNFCAALAAGLALALPVVFLSGGVEQAWMIFGGTALLAVLSIIVSRSSDRAFAETLGVALMTAAFTGGVVHLLAHWLAATWARGGPV